MYNNPNLSISFRFEAARREQRKFAYKEVLSLLALIYTTQIETGHKQLSDYAGMTARSFQRELLFRSLILDGQIRIKKEAQQKKQKAAENALLEALKRAGK